MYKYMVRPVGQTHARQYIVLDVLLNKNEIFFFIYCSLHCKGILNVSSFKQLIAVYYVIMISFDCNLISFIAEI